MIAARAEYVHKGLYRIVAALDGMPAGHRIAIDRGEMSRIECEQVHGPALGRGGHAETIIDQIYSLIVGSAFCLRWYEERGNGRIIFVKEPDGETRYYQSPDRREPGGLDGSDTAYFRRECGDVMRQPFFQTKPLKFRAAVECAARPPADTTNPKRLP